MHTHSQVSMIMENTDMDRRPSTKHSHHQWHAVVHGRSHFEDFMLEIGANPRVAHLCCVPRPEIMEAYHTSKKSKSKSPSRGPSHAYEQPMYPSKHETPKFQTPFPSSQAPAAHSPAVPNLLQKLSHRIFASASKTSAQAVPVLKSHLTSGVDTQSFTSSRPTLPVATARDKLHQIAGHEDIGRRSSHASVLSDDSQWHWNLENTSHSHQTTSSSQLSSSSEERSSPLDIPRSRAPSFSSIATASSSEGPKTPRPSSLLPTLARESDLSLSDIEQMSKLRSPTSCVTCRRTGSNFPSCSKCGDMWCSRKCRMTACKNGRHSCHQPVSGIF